MIRIQKSPYKAEIGRCLCRGGVIALSIGSVAYLQNRFNAIDLFKRFDPTYAAPPFTTALVLATPLFGLELLSRSIQVLTIGVNQNNNSRRALSDFQNRLSDRRKLLLFRLVMTAAKTFIFIKGAKAIVNRGWPVHQGFIYQAAFIYALNSFNDNPFISLLYGWESMMFAALMTGLFWIVYRIGLDSLIQKIVPSYAIPSYYSEIFVWNFSGAAAFFVLFNITSSAASLGLEEKAFKDCRKVIEIANNVMSYLLLYGFAKMLNTYGFSLNDKFICVSVTLVAFYDIFLFVSGK